MTRDTKEAAAKVAEAAGREERIVRLTPEGILTGAFSRLVEEAESPNAWWRTSPILAGIGLAYHLSNLGYQVVPVTDGLDEEVLAAALHRTGPDCLDVPWQSCGAVNHSI